MAAITNINIGQQPLVSGTKPFEKSSPGVGPSFKEALGEQLGRGQEPMAPVVKTMSFSNHAVERMSRRGLHFSAEQMTKIEAAVNKLAEKGAKESLIVAADNAMIVDVPNRKVVTVMDKNMMKENVFTKIDSTVIV